MTHPHQLHAHAAAWSLRTARQRLLVAAAIRAREDAIASTEGDDGLRSQTFGQRSALGHIGDPTADAALTGHRPTTRPNPYLQLAERVTSTLAWLAGKLGVTGTTDPLVRLTAAVPTLRPSTAGELHRWLAGEDARLRAALGMEPDRRPIPGAPPCPACGMRLLRTQTSAPDRSAWTVVCTSTSCRCAGLTCTCDMPIRAAGVAHIWATAEACASTRRRISPGRITP